MNDKCDLCDNKVVYTRFDVAIEDAFDAKGNPLPVEPKQQLCRACWDRDMETFQEEMKRGYH